MRESPRIRRLRTDLKALERLKAESSILDFNANPTTHGQPPEAYQIRFYGRGLWRPANSPEIAIRERHEVTIQLGASYPRMMPELLWRSPIFHPNISGSGVVCLGGYGTYWVPSLNLDELCGMLWDMIRYANFDVESPYNREAAVWAKTQTQFRLPLDNRPIRDRLAGVNSEPQGRPPITKLPQPVTPDGMLIIESEVIDAEIVEAEDQDILFLD